MKRIKLIPTLVCLLLMIGLMVANSCTKQTTTPAAPTCTNSGTSVNIGSSVGGSFLATVDYVNSVNYYIDFVNTNLNFYVTDSGHGGGTILDVGQQSCLDFSYSGTPVASTVAYKKGEGYVGVFKDGHIVKFITISYSGGVALIEYVFQ